MSATKTLQALLSCAVQCSDGRTRCWDALVVGRTSCRDALAVRRIRMRDAFVGGTDYILSQVEVGCLSELRSAIMCLREAHFALHRLASMVILWTLPVLRAGSQGTKLSVNLEHETMRTNCLLFSVYRKKEKHF